MSYGYGGRPNPYDQRGEAPSAPPGSYNSQPSYSVPQASYGRQQYSSPAMGRDDYAGQNVEMAPLAQNGSQFGRQQDPNAILNECREISNGIESIKRNLAELTALQRRALDSDQSTQSTTNVELDRLSSNTMAMYRNFAGRIKAIKQRPESGSQKNAPQVGNVDRKLKAAIVEYQQLESAFRNKMQEQMARQYRIVRPDASESEVRAAVEDTSNQQVFSQALLQSDRRGQSRQALNAVQNRHEAIQNIERQMVELASLFQEMEELVVQQEVAVTNIEMKGEEVVDNMDKGTAEIGVAIKSARNRNKLKWWCLGICILIVIIIVVVVIIYKFVIQTPVKTARRWVITDSVPSLHITPASGGPIDSGPGANNDIVIPGKPWSGEKIVVPGLDWTPDNSLVTAKAALPGREEIRRKLVKFAA